jgi:hypothetical protein
MKFLIFYLLLWVIVALLDPDPDSEYGSVFTDLIESGSSSDPDPQIRFCLGLAPARSLLPSFSGPTAPQPVAPTAPQLSAAYQLPAALPVPLDNRYHRCSSFKVNTSIVDPDTFVFGPPGSFLCTDPHNDHSINKQKK